MINAIMAGAAVVGGIVDSVISSVNNKRRQKKNQAIAKHNKENQYKIDTNDINYTKLEQAKANLQDDYLTGKDKYARVTNRALKTKEQLINKEQTKLLKDSAELRKGMKEYV